MGMGGIVNSRDRGSEGSREGAGEESAARGAAHMGCCTPTTILADVPTQMTQNRQLIVKNAQRRT